MAWLRKHLPKFKIKKTAQTTEATREAEALNLRLRQGAEELGKTYSDIVEFEKRLTPEEGLKALEGKSSDFMKGVDELLSGIHTAAQSHIDTAKSRFKEKFGA